MITGFVTADREAVIWLKLYGPNTLEADIPVVIDTGFTEHLTLPQSWIDAMAFPYLRTDDVTLADGSVIQVTVHEGAILWDGNRLFIEAHVLEGSPVVGMSLMDNYLLSLPVCNGDTFTISLLP